MASNGDIGTYELAERAGHHRSARWIDNHTLFSKFQIP
jgi:hypothetical protein